MALDRRTRLASSTIILSLLLACTPAPNEAADASADARAPQPTAVCQHLRTLAANDTTDELLLDQVQRDCVQALEGLATRYETFATCVQDATTSAAVRECEKALAKPPSLLASASPTAQLDAVCDHVIGILRASIPQMGTSVDPADVAKLRQRCIEDAGKKRDALGAEEFSKRVECLLAAQDMPTLQACGSF
jgi:hypothetical protein